MTKINPIFIVAKKWVRRNKKLMKQLLITCTAALLIGVGFGVFFIQMMKQEERTKAVAESTKTTTTKGDIHRTSEKNILPEISLFVVQGGVFSEYENYENWTRKFNDLDVHVMNWEREGNHHLFTTIASKVDIANEAAKRIEEKGLDAYVKEWTVSEANLEMSQEAFEWMNRVYSLWEMSLQAIEAGEEFPMAKWQALLEGAPEEIEEWKAFYEAILAIIDEEDERVTNNYRLLKILHAYEMFVVET